MNRRPISVLILLLLVMSVYFIASYTKPVYALGGGHYGRWGRAGEQGKLLAYSSEQFDPSLGYEEGSATNQEVFSSYINTSLDLSGGTDHNGQDWAPSNGEVISGKHYNISKFTIQSGITVYFNDGTVICANDVVILGILDGTGRASGGSGAAIEIYASNSIDVEGSIISNGNGGSGGAGGHYGYNDYHAAGGGDGGNGKDGGLVKLEADTVSVAGNVYLRGGGGGGAGGGGAYEIGSDIPSGTHGGAGGTGGRGGNGGSLIIKYKTSYSVSGSVDVRGGGGGGGGGGGANGEPCHQYFSASHNNGKSGSAGQAGGAGGKGGNGGDMQYDNCRTCDNNPEWVYGGSGGNGGGVGSGGGHGAAGNAYSGSCVTEYGGSGGGGGSAGSSGSHTYTQVSSLSYEFLSESTQTSGAVYHVNTTLAVYSYDVSCSIPNNGINKSITILYPNKHDIINITASGQAVPQDEYSVSSYDSAHDEVILGNSVIGTYGTSYTLYVKSTQSIYSLSSDYTYNSPGRGMSFTVKVEDPSGSPLSQDVKVAVWTSTSEVNHVSGSTNSQGSWSSTITLPSSEGTYYLRAVTGGDYAGLKYIQIKVTSISVTLSSSDDRVNVGDTVTISGTARYTVDSSSVSSGSVTVNGTSYTVSSGSFSFTYSESSVSKIVFEAASASDGGGVSNAASASTSVIWDKLQITISTNDSRTDISSSVTISWSVKYEYDNTPENDFNMNVEKDGASWYSGTSTSYTDSDSSVTSHSYTVSSITGNTYGITAFDSNSITVIWDRIEVYDYGVSDSRADVGSTQNVWFKLRYDYDDVTFDNSKGSVSINGVSATWDSGNSRWYITDTESSVGKYDYTLSFADNTYGLTAYTGVTAQSVIFDKVIFTLSASDNRVDVGSTVTINVDGKYAYDDSAFSGTYQLNDTTTSQSSVGARGYKIIGMSDGKYGLTVFETNSIKVIWDKVIFTLSAPERVNVGSSASINVDGKYAYDNAAFQGIYSLNDDTTKNTVGKYSYEVSSMTDNNYGLTVFDTNTIDVIFDKLDIQLSVQDARINIGDTASITATISHEYDGLASQATYVLNDSLTKNQVGIYYYRVSSVSGDQYSITVFDTNTVSVIFDALKITSVESFGFDANGNFKFSVSVEYAYDGSDAPFTMRIYNPDRTGYAEETVNTLTLSASENGNYSFEAVDDQGKYGITRCILNQTYQLYPDLVSLTGDEDLSGVEIATSPNKEISNMQYSSGELSFTVYDAEVYLYTGGRGKPISVKIDGAAVQEGSRWEYTSGQDMLWINVRSSDVLVKWYVPTVSMGDEVSGPPPDEIKLVVYNYGDEPIYIDKIYVNGTPPLDYELFDMNGDIVGSIKPHTMAILQIHIRGVDISKEIDVIIISKSGKIYSYTV